MLIWNGTVAFEVYLKHQRIFSLRYTYWNGSLLRIITTLVRIHITFVWIDSLLTKYTTLEGILILIEIYIVALVVYKDICNTRTDSHWKW